MQGTAKIDGVVAQLRAAERHLHNANVVRRANQARLLRDAAGSRIGFAIRTLSGMMLRNRIAEYLEVGNDPELNSSLHLALSQLTGVLSKAS